VPFEVGTFNNDSAAKLGIPQLKQEESQKYWFYSKKP
jgi:hypothetical protein